MKAVCNNNLLLQPAHQKCAAAAHMRIEILVANLGSVTEEPSVAIDLNPQRIRLVVV